MGKGEKFMKLEEKKQVKNDFNTPLNKVDLFLTLSTLCNYNCVFCNRGVKGELIRLDEFSKFDELVYYAKMVDITGYGEITIHPDFCQIMEKFNSKNIPIRFVTNASKIDKEKATIIANSNMSELVISLNSLNSETYEKFHGNNASLEKTQKNIDYLLSLRPKFPVRLSFIMTSWNFEEIPNFIEYVKNYKGKIASMNCAGLISSLIFRYPPDLMVKNTAENREYLESMRMYAKECGVDASIAYLENQTTSEAKIVPERLEKIIKRCDWVYNKIFIEADGSVKPCCWSRVNLGNVKESTLEEIWNGEKYTDLRRAISNGETTYCSECRREN